MHDILFVFLLYPRAIFMLSWLYHNFNSGASHLIIGGISIFSNFFFNQGNFSLESGIALCFSSTESNSVFFAFGVGISFLLENVTFQSDRVLVLEDFSSLKLPSGVRRKMTSGGS